MKHKVKNSNDEEIDIIDGYFVGEVKEIINNYRLVVTDYDSELNIGDIISVIEPSLEIKDENDVIVDYFYFEKAELKVTHILNKHAICFTNEESVVKSPLTQLISGYPGQFDFTDKVQPKSLSVDKPLNLKMKSKKIMRGDLIVKKI